MARKNDSLPVLRKRVKGVDIDSRPHLTMPSKLQVEAGRKQWRLVEAVRKVHPGATSRFRGGMMQIAYPDQSQPPDGIITWAGKPLLIGNQTEPTPTYPYVVLCEAEADWKLGNVADLPAWTKAYKMVVKR